MTAPAADLLSRILEVSDKTLDRATGDMRRLDRIELLFEEASRFAARLHDGPRAFVNEWTLLLLTMLRKLERHGPLGDAREIKRAMTVAAVVREHVIADSLDAHLYAANARPSTSDHDFKHRRGGE